MESPFVPAMRRHPRLLAKALVRLQDAEYITRSEAAILSTVAMYTPNEKLLRGITSFSIDTLRELAEVSLIGLKALRPLTNSSTSLVGASGAGASQTDSPNASQRVQKPGAKIPTEQLGHSQIELLEIETEFPELLSKLGPQSPAYSKLARTRQLDICLLTGKPFSLPVAYGDTFQLFPYGLMHLASNRNKITWRFLAIFLGEGLRDQLYADLISEKHGIHTAANAISLGLSTAFMLDLGFLTLTPILESDPPGHWIDVRLTWRYLEHYTFFSSVFPSDPKDQYQYDADGRPIMRNLTTKQNRGIEPIKAIRIATLQPDELPVPSAMLLFWHAVIWNVVGHAGLAETLEDYNKRKRAAYVAGYDDEDDYAMEEFDDEYFEDTVDADEEPSFVALEDMQDEEE
ncbi:hypothetical protein ABW21_db0200340 [Orbilia brochopaga]|nr:hypothetical protein ABW21_db0200340 [Drechslerella brochopaga]